MWQIELVSIFIILLNYSLCKETQKIESAEYGIVPGKARTNCTCGKANRDLGRIIGGGKTSENEFPMMAAIILRKMHFYGEIYKNIQVCGGTVITHRHVLSACHCFFDKDQNQLKPEQIGVLLGAHNIKEYNFNNTIIPEQIILHPNYVHQKNGQLMLFDLAVMVLPYITFTDIIGPVCLPAKPFFPKNKRLTTLGWGDTNGMMKKSDVLKKTTIFGLTHKSCKIIHNKNNLPYDNGTEQHQLCTYKKKTSQCIGDSGGPVMWVDPDTNRYTLVGVNSYVITYCQAQGVSSDITSFLPWIQQVIARTYPEERTCAKHLII